VSGQVGTASVTLPFPIAPFLTGTDYFIPIGPTPLSIVMLPRGDTSATRTVNVRRIPSTEGRMVVQLHDFEL
jgi:hypothetical protein